MGGDEKVEQEVKNVLMSDVSVARTYQLKSGDVFTISGSKALIYAMSKSNFYHMFLPVRCYRRWVWYKPKTWFQIWYDIMYVENGEVPVGGEKDVEVLHF